MARRRRGAFTGAVAQRKVLFEEADGCTVFLDEIGELPVKVNVRIVAATNRDFREEIRKVRFREDLFYRLSVLPLQITFE